MDRSPATRTFPAEAFHFSGQSRLDAWTLRDLFQAQGWAAYDRFLSHEPELCLQRIRELIEAFPTYQRFARTGRKPYVERVHLLAAMLKQFFDVSYRSLESHLRLLAEFFGLEKAPDGNTLSAKNRTRRFTKLLKRFHAWLLDQLPPRKAVIAVDATGFSNKKRPWSETDFGLRAHEDWLKVHAAVEVPTLLIVSSVITKGKVHDSRAYEDVWLNMHPSVTPIRSLADAAYAGEDNLETAKAYGATPLHRFRKDARHRARPTTHLQKLVNFATHWPNRFHDLVARRSLVETAFSSEKRLTGHQLRCRNSIARRNEILAKHATHNARILIMRSECGLPGF